MHNGRIRKIQRERGAGVGIGVVAGDYPEACLAKAFGDPAGSGKQVYDSEGFWDRAHGKNVEVDRSYPKLAVPILQGRTSDPGN